MHSYSTAGPIEKVNYSASAPLSRPHPSAWGGHLLYKEKGKGNVPFRGEGLRCFFALLLSFLSFQSFFAQQPATTKAAVEKALAENNTALAETLLQQQVERFYAAGQADSLTGYLVFAGKIEKLKSGAEAGAKRVETLLEKIKSLRPSTAVLRQAYIEAGEYYGFAGKNNLAYKANKEALAYTKATPGHRPAQLGTIESNLGTYAQRVGDLALSAQHQRQAFAYRQSDPQTDAESLYISYNNMGSILWYASKLDSALYFFNKAVETLKKTEPTPVNQYYRPALVLNNVSGIYSLQGKATEAIKTLQTAILNLKTFIATPEPHSKKAAATSLQFEATDNLAGIYKDLGNYRQAHELLLYSYRQKQAVLGPDDPAVFISQILLGQLYYAMKEQEKALQYLNGGLAAIAKADGDYTFWKADACNTLALLYDSRKDTAKATLYYEQADALYEESLQGDYDNIYLEFLSNAAVFYAENGTAAKALAKARKGYDYILKTEGAGTLAASRQLLNLSEVHYLSGQYKESLSYSKQALGALNKAIERSKHALDSVKMELKKPKAVLQKAKAGYALFQPKTADAMNGLLAELSEALAILERRKTVLTDAGDIGLLMADQSELIRFIEKITLDLYKLTGDNTYLTRFVGLHESALYNRIRARLDKSNIQQFAHVPPGVQAQERRLKEALMASLAGNGSHNEKMAAYFSAAEAWNKHQERLRKDFPRYYQMRYASIFKSLNDVRSLVPAGTTLVRYFFNERELFALVADAGNQTIVPLPANDLEREITSLATYAYDAAKTGESLFRLYQQLWAPLAGHVKYPRLVIIPDGILFNLSFETLTPKKISSFKELAGNSLLASHSIAYHYSLFLLGQKESAPPGESFVAFAPGFTDRVKAAYRSSAGSAALPDNNYLSLLPQPFTLDLANKAQKLLGGKTFLHEASTAASFKQHAGNHKIIHIGTHAESNNLHPEFSRLIFAKNNPASGEDNSLYLPEIYNCNLTAGLAVLTACESGKPGYEDGEGMVSLAHAFNYAGSESILTGLWKIDEQVSAKLMEAFYQNIVKGMPKDEALRQAKLTYLQGAGGRALSPQYWAGLVIMGNPEPLALASSRSFRWWWVLAAGLLLLFVGIVFSVLRRNATTLRGRPSAIVVDKADLPA